MFSQYRRIYQDKSTFFCFIPMVSLATFIIEIILAGYVLFRYKLTKFSSLSIAMLICLGLFQLMEYLTCTNYSAVWIKIGYIAITFLPALGIHLIATMTKRYTKLVYLAYSFVAIFIYSILFVPEINLFATCEPNFVNVHNHYLFGLAHFWYYSAFVLAAIYILWHSMRKHIGDTKEEKWLLIATVSFVTPALALFYLKIIDHLALPSVMCGFAIIVALILVLIVIPRYYLLLKRKKK